jgi:hypothetical protein
MSDTKTTNVPLALLYDKTSKQQRLHAELRPGRRWTRWGKRGWWLRCFPFLEQGGSWHKRRFVATLAEACTLLHVHADDWTWQPVARSKPCDQESKRPPSVLF